MPESLQREFALGSEILGLARFAQHRPVWAEHGTEGLEKKASLPQWAGPALSLDVLRVCAW